MTEWPSLHYTSPRTSNRCSGLAQILEGCIPNRKKMCNGQDTWNRLLVRKQWRFGYYWRINTKSLLPETHRLSLYQQDLLRTRVLFLLLQICTLAFNVVSCASLSVFPLLHTFFFSQRFKALGFSPHIAQGTHLSTESISTPSLEVDRFLLALLPSCPADCLPLCSATFKGHLS